MQEVAVRGVDLHHVEARVIGAPGGFAERHDDLAHVGHTHGLGRWIIVRERDGAWRQGFPSLLAVGRVLRVQLRAPVPGPACRTLAACVGQLDPGGGAIGLQEIGDARQGPGLFVVPDPHVSRAYATARFNAGGLDEYERGAAEGETAKMHQMPIAGDAIDGAVLAHG